MATTRLTPDEHSEPRLSRRAFLHSTAAGGAGLLAAWLVGCDDGDGTEPQATATRPAPTLTPAPAEPSATPSALSWRRLSPSGELPPPRRDHSLVLGDRIYLFGGRGESGDLADLWTYERDIDAWLPVQVEGPPPRHGHNAIWAAMPDDRPDRMLVFGGQQGSSFFNDTWAFEPELQRWTQLTSDDPAPAPRYGAGGALGTGGRMLVTHGFTNSGRFDDTWAFDFVTAGAWEETSPSGTRPVERCLMRAVWDRNGGRLLMFGGQTTGTPFLGDLWALELDGWRQLASGPSPRTFYAMVFDQATDRLILFGGRTEDGPENDVWFFDSPGNSWEQASPEGEAPAPRFGHDAVWDGATRSFIVFGGNDGTTDLNDTWELSVPS